MSSDQGDPGVGTPERIADEQVPCAQCGRPTPFDTVLPSEIWNEAVRAAGLPDYLCQTCIFEHFAKRQESFTFELWGAAFNGLVGSVHFNNRRARGAVKVVAANTELRHRLSEAERACMALRQRAEAAEAQVDASAARIAAVEKALPPDPRDGIDLLDRVTNLVAKVQEAHRSLDFVAGLEREAQQYAEKIADQQDEIAALRTAKEAAEAQVQALTAKLATIDAWADAVRCGDADWKLCDLDELLASPPRAATEKTPLEIAEREVFNIVHRGGLRGDFTDEDLKAAGQDWGDAPRVGSAPSPRKLVWGTNVDHPETGPEWLTPEETAAPPPPSEET